MKQLYLLDNVLWLSDLHIDHIVSKNTLDTFLSVVKAQKPDSIWITGDISSGEHLTGHLAIFDGFGVPVFFVPGNHDFYGKDIHSVNIDLSRYKYRNVVLLQNTLCSITIGLNTALVGVGGWGDGFWGNWNYSQYMADWKHIEDFKAAPTRRFESERIAREHAAVLDLQLQSVPSYMTDIVILTHVPPFRDMCMYNGRPANNDYIAFFACGRLGQIISRHAYLNRSKRYHIFSGHTHHAYKGQLADNIFGRVVSSEYGSLNFCMLNKADFTGESNE